MEPEGILQIVLDNSACMTSVMRWPGPFSETEGAQAREKFKSLFLQWGSIIHVRSPPGDVKKIINAWVK